MFDIIFLWLIIFYIKHIKNISIQDRNYTMQNGTVKWFNKKKGIGFIISEETNGDIFIHYSNIIGEGYKNLEEGDAITFLLEDSDKGFIGKEIKKID
jgi:CspA family cold shock protein